MQYYIYMTTNTVNNKRYIGQHKGEPNDNYIGSGTAITKAIKKYGKNNFTKKILCYCNTREEADKKEKYYIKKYDAVNNKQFYNCQEGGTNGDGWECCHKWMREHPKDAKKIYQQNAQRLKQWQKDNPEKVKDNIKAFTEGSKKWRKEHPEEVEKILNNLQKEKRQWQQTHKEEYQKQIEEWRKKGSESNSIKIICTTTNEVFSSLCEASRKYPTAHQTNITKCLKGERKSAGTHPVTKQKLYWKKYNTESEGL